VDDNVMTRYMNCRQEQQQQQQQPWDLPMGCTAVAWEATSPTHALICTEPTTMEVPERVWDHFLEVMRPEEAGKRRMTKEAAKRVKIKGVRKSRRFQK
jgi:hypothetical protein